MLVASTTTYLLEGIGLLGLIVNEARPSLKKRLDRKNCNQHWLSTCTITSCTILVRNRSNNFPLLLDFQIDNHDVIYQLKFMRIWNLNDTWKPLVAELWATRVIGCPMFVLNIKLKILKSKLKIWNKSIISNVFSKVKIIEECVIYI